MCLPVTRDKFEEIGVSLQETAKNMAQSEQRFNYSCTLCTLYKRRSDCSACPIRESMISNIEWFGARIVDYPWVEKELTSAN